MDSLGQECDDETNDSNEGGKNIRKTGIVKEVEDWVGLGPNGPDGSIGRAVDAASSKDVISGCICVAA